ncbi:hypothetical protein GW17_00055866 [Ensete ventricosum]|nr:hypothetical protein GW17_00055866 [Ensete ventricosum]
MCASTPVVISNRVETGNGWVEGAPGPTRSFYNGCYRSFVPEIFIASMAYHAVVLLHIIRGHCSEVRALPAAVVTCRPYPCQVDRTIVGSSIPMLGQLRCGESAMLEIYTPAIVSNRVEMGNDWVEGAPESNSVGWLRVCWNSGRGSTFTGHSYLRSLLPLRLTIPSYFSTPSVVLAMRRTLPAAAVMCRPYPCQRRPYNRWLLHTCVRSVSL